MAARLRNAGKLLLAFTVAWIVLEGVSFGVLRLLGDGASVNDAPGDQNWLRQAKLGFQDGLYRWDEWCLWRLAPNYTRAESSGRRFWGDGPLVLNEHGMRGPSVTVEKPAGVRRVLILGGSHPMGMYVNAGESYGAVLERKLNAAGKGRWQVLNASAPGYTSWQGRQLLAHYGLAFSPDVVISDLGVNDTLELSAEFPKPDKEVREPPRWAQDTRSVLELSAVYRLVRRLVAWRPGKDPLRRVSPEDHVQNLRAMQALGASKGFHVLFVTQVLIDKENGRSRCLLPEDGLEPVVDTCALFQEQEDGAGRLFVDTMHATAEGHALIAEAMYDRLLELGWTR